MKWFARYDPPWVTFNTILALTISLLLCLTYVTEPSLKGKHTILYVAFLLPVGVLFVHFCLWLVRRAKGRTHQE